MTEDRLIQVETKVDGLVENMKEVNSVLKEISASLNKLAILEDRYNSIIKTVKRAFDDIEKCDVKREKIESRLVEIEKAMPMVQAINGFWFKLILGIMSALSIAAILTIIRSYH